jgi:hypothetical protein
MTRQIHVPDRGLQAYLLQGLGEQVVENFALWALTILSVLVALCGIVIQANADPELVRVGRVVAARRKTPARRAAIVLIVLGLCNAVFWTMVAIGSGEWRWAVIFWVPFAAGWLGRAAHAGQKPADGGSREDAQP